MDILQDMIAIEAAATILALMEKYGYKSEQVQAAVARFSVVIPGFAVLASTVVAVLEDKDKFQEIVHHEETDT